MTFDEKSFDCKEGYNVRVLRSNAGYYVGTQDESGVPYCRLSGYYETENQAQGALMHGFKIRDAVEINWCCQSR